MVDERLVFDRECSNRSGDEFLFGMRVARGLGQKTHAQATRAYLAQPRDRRTPLIQLLHPPPTFPAVLPSFSLLIINPRPLRSDDNVSWSWPQPRAPQRGRYPSRHPTRLEATKRGYRWSTSCHDHRKPGTGMDGWRPHSHRVRSFLALFPPSLQLSTLRLRTLFAELLSDMYTHTNSSVNENSLTG